jgi:hypothetical protein
MTNADESETYEPTMVIRHDNKLGRSFMITLSAFWKYISPEDNFVALKADTMDFEDKVRKTQAALKFCLVGSPAREQAKDDMVDLTLAIALHEATSILPCVCFNLSKCLRMFDIEVRPEAAIQLHLWIQDGIEELKNMPELPPEKELNAGDVTLFAGGKKVGTQELTVKESDLVIEGGEA